MPTIQTVSNSDFSAFYCCFARSSLFLLCKEIPPRKKTRPCTSPSFLPSMIFYSCFVAPCVTLTHTLLQTSCSVMKRKLEEKWWWAGRGYLMNRFVQLRGVSWYHRSQLNSVKNCSPPDPTAVLSADSAWDVLTCPRNHIKEFQRIHSKSIIQTAQLNFTISYQNLSPSYTAAKLS